MKELTDLEKTAMRVPRVLNAPTYFYLDGDEWFVEEQGWFPLQIGAGVLSNDGRFFRVKDVWFSFDHHGRHPEGLHVFMEDAKIDPSLIQDRDRDYYGALLDE